MDFFSIFNMTFLALLLIFFIFAAVMCDFLNRDERFLVADSTDQLDSVIRKFSRMFSILEFKFLNASIL